MKISDSWITAIWVITGTLFTFFLLSAGHAGTKTIDQCYGELSVYLETTPADILKKESCKIIKGDEDCGPLTDDELKGYIGILMHKCLTNQL